MELQYEVLQARAVGKVESVRARVACRGCFACDSRTADYPRCAIRTEPVRTAVGAPTTIQPASHRLLSALWRDYAAGDVPVVSAVACGDRVTNRALAACRARLWRELEGMGWPAVVLVGDHAVWRGDLTEVTVGGWAFVWGTATAGDLAGVPVFVLGDVARAAGDRGALKRVVARADKMLECVEAGDWSRAAKAACVRCGSGRRLRYDPDAVPYCGRCWDQWKNEWKRQRVGAATTAMTAKMPPDGRSESSEVVDVTTTLL